VTASLVVVLLFLDHFVGLVRWGRFPVPTEQQDPLKLRHEILKRTDSHYALRLESIQRLRASGLAPGHATSVEDELLSASHELLVAHTSHVAEAIATRRVVLMAPKITTACGKAGIVLGPQILPELIQSRFNLDEDRKRLAELIAEYQFAELVRTLVGAHTQSSAQPDHSD